MKRGNFCNFLILNIAGIMLMVACNKEEEKIPPTINFKTGTEFTADNAIAMVGAKLRFGIQARANSANITNFTVRKFLVDGTSITVMDTGTNSESLDIEKTFYQSVEDEVEWTFTVMDKNRMSSHISLTVLKDPNSQFGGIFYYPSLKMGFQNNTEYGHFLDPFTGKAYFGDSATLLQNSIHFLVYFFEDNNEPSPTFSSSGEMDNSSTEALSYYPEISTWQVRNYTLWDISVEDDPIPVDAFDEAFNDSLLIVSYDEVWGKKKFKWVQPNQVIPFKTADGKFGLVKVIDPGNSDTGIMEFALKIQQ